MSDKQRRLQDYLMRRRQVLQGGAAAAATLMAPGLAGRAVAAPADPLHFVGWQYNPQIVAENVDTFKELYDENVEYELVPGEYHAVAETKLIAGQHIDMMYSEEDRIVRWNRAGWTRSLEGLPGLDDIKANMYDVNVHNMSLPSGEFGGLPYYTGFNSFVCNQKHLDAAEIEPPATLDELMDQCRKLKADVPTEMLAWGGGSGPEWFLFPHTMDVTRWILQQEPKEIYAKGRKDVLAGMGIDAFDAIQALVEFETCIVTFETCWIIPNSYPTVVDNKYTLYGSEGCIELDSTPGIAISSDRYKYPFGSHAITRYGKPFAHFYESIRHFADCIAEDKPPQATGHDGLMATAMIQATVKSLTESRPVKMTEVLG